MGLQKQVKVLVHIFQDKLKKMKNKQIKDFLADIIANNYDMNFISKNSTNILMDEGEMEYQIELDNISQTILMYFINDLEYEPNKTKLIVDELYHFITINELSEARTFFILYKKEWILLKKKLEANKIDFNVIELKFKKFSVNSEVLNELKELFYSIEVD